jgi:ligand-binding sensor domain-containing protein
MMKKYYYSLLPLLIFITSVSTLAQTTSSELPKMIKSQGKYSYHTGTGPRTDTNVAISSILEDNSGNIWAATMGEGVYRYNGKSFKNFTVKDGLLTNLVYSMIQDKEGNIWFATTGGASLYDGKSFKNFPFSVIRGNSPAQEVGANPSFPPKEVWSILLDKKGNIWFGTTVGLYRYNGKTFTNIVELDTSKNANKEFNNIAYIMEDKEGNIWFTSWNAGLCCFNGNAITIFTSKGHVLSNNSILQDKNGNIWISERGNGGVSRYDGKTFKSFFPGIVISDMKQDAAGNIWFATFDRNINSGGAVLYNPSTTETIAHFTAIDGHSNNYVTSITIDTLGKVWFGTNKMTLSSYDGKTFTNFYSE